MEQGELWAGRSELQDVSGNGRVFISNFFGAKNWGKLEAAGISHILVCAAELPMPFESKLNYKRLNLADNTHVELPLCEALKFINDALENDNAKVLVHCAAGSSRSGAVCIAWRIAHSELSALDAIRELQSIRPIILPNPGFVEQLIAFEENIRSQSAEGSNI